MPTTQNPDEFRRSSRCHVCRLPPARLDQLHRDRLQVGLTFEALAQNCRADGFAVSESSLRRHFHHVPAMADFPMPTWEPDLQTAAQDVPTAFDGLVGAKVNERLTLEAMTNALIEKIQIAEKECKAVAGRCPQAEQKAFARFEKLQAALARSMKQLREARRLREEMDAIILKIGEAVGDATFEGGRQFMRNHVGWLRDAFEAYLAGQMSEIVLVRKLEQFEREWSVSLGQAVGEAVAGKLKDVAELREWLEVA